MVPIGGIVFAALLLARAAKRAGTPAQAPPPPKGRQPAPKGSTGSLRVLLWIGILSVGAIGGNVVARYPGAWPWFVPGLIGCLFLLFPWRMNRLVFIPLGWPWVAYHLNRLAGSMWAGDIEEGQCVAALLAMMRSGKRDERFLTRIEQTLRPKRMRGATVLAYALLFAVRGHHDIARKLAASVRTLSPKVAPWLVVSLADEWVMMEAASRGDWMAVHEAGDIAERRTWMSTLLHRVAGRVLGFAVPFEPRQLWSSWLSTGHWISTWSLLKRGLNPDPVPAPAAPKPLQLEGKDQLRDALGLHVAALRTPPAELLAEHVRVLGQAWDAALDETAMQARFASRATSLAVLPSQLPVDSIRETVIADLVTTLRVAKLPTELWSEGSPILEDMAEKLRDKLIEGVEAAVQALARRKAAQKALPAVDEWREWLALREQYEEAGRICGMSFRRLAFRPMHHDACNYAVWLFNVRFEYPIANAMFTWLLAEARSVEDLSAISLEAGNVKAGCGY